ncbi:hypothetical protein F751_4730 [Auxenochlorella protothecoides]|uniref:Uncharacterized protein n=1 Tax=Auxenochlorella protothecoides TaxID=3075 RepID=A0A087SKI3_AUXPR|nr:hypothetical protein F751_4730 [Auxenochlorella protothecoides]KFM26237.1 hypothetical protein F751_4730 [Auxenochlorella protothecoides]
MERRMREIRPSVVSSSVIFSTAARNPRRLVRRRWSRILPMMRLNKKDRTRKKTSTGGGGGRGGIASEGPTTCVG